MHRRAHEIAAAQAQLVEAMPGVSGIAYDLAARRLRVFAATNDGACRAGALLGVAMIAVPMDHGGWIMCGDAFHSGLTIIVEGPPNQGPSAVEAARIEQGIAAIRASAKDRGERPRAETAATTPMAPIKMAALVRGDDDRDG